MQPDLSVKQFSPVTLDSPLAGHPQDPGGRIQFVDEDHKLLFDPSTQAQPGSRTVAFERAGPRRRIFYDPASTRAAVVTCGGICPGLNDVIRALVLELYHWYGVKEVLGIRYGYSGLAEATDCPPIPLTVEDVSEIHTMGGTVLGSSRGALTPREMVTTLQRLDVNILICIGGDGTLCGVHAIAEEILQRDLKIAVVGIPKTIDNDIALVYQSFGFQTAVAEATRVLLGAHNEAKGARHGVGLVRLMGRHAGFIAAHATLASGDVNYCLVPEVQFRLDGERGLLQHLHDRLGRRRHAVIAVAEGTGMELMGHTDERDASGNIRFKDVGLFLKEAIGHAFADWGEEVHVKYFDPSYIIRSVPANSHDSIFCADLARCAVHGAMAGKTDMLIGFWHGVFTHVPLVAIAGRRKQINPDGHLWRSVLATTGQPTRWE